MEKMIVVGNDIFDEFIKEDGYYVDKTELMYKLAREKCPFFLSRPRRFGKSLLLSTFEAFFEGKKELNELARFLLFRMR